MAPKSSTPASNRWRAVTPDTAPQTRLPKQTHRREERFSDRMPSRSWRMVPGPGCTSIRRGVPRDDTTDDFESRDNGLGLPCGPGGRARQPEPEADLRGTGETFGAGR